MNISVIKLKPSTCEKLMPDLESIFGKGKFALFPCREGDTWEFIIIDR